MQALEVAQAAAETARQQAGEASARAARYKRAFRDIDQMISWARTPSSARRSEATGSTLWTTGCVTEAVFRTKHVLAEPRGLILKQWGSLSINQSITHFQHGAGCVSKEILYLVSP